MHAFGLFKEATTRMRLKRPSSSLKRQTACASEADGDTHAFKEAFKEALFLFKEADGVRIKKQMDNSYTSIKPKENTYTSIKPNKNTYTSITACLRERGGGPECPRH